MAEYRIEFLKTAQKELSKLPREIQTKIALAIDFLKLEPYPNNVKKLKGSEGLFRIRVGDYRIIYKIENKNLIILVVKIGHRRDIYQ
ncbi:MAG: type II toxin-antitoxin system RelE/ParE family toxin [Snowella sp.]|nr:type II toxin-antitoxin system RelE/ParE family toxin [Snowella sp.]